MSFDVRKFILKIEKYLSVDKDAPFSIVKDQIRMMTAITITISDW